MHDLVRLLHRENLIHLLLAVVDEGGAGLAEVPRPLGDELRIVGVDHLACEYQRGTDRERVGGEAKAA